MKRKRKAIKSKDKLASALAMLLPQSERDRMRRGQLRAEYILSLFEFHHIVFHAHGGSDDWWNLHPMDKDEHRARSKGLRSDTSVVAKVKRLRQSPQAVAGKPKPKVGKTPRVARRRITDVPKRSWGAPGLRRKVNGEVVRSE